MIRKFQKFFTREISLIVIEYWHRGEYKGLQELLKGATHFNPLFIRRSDGLTDIYYDMNNPDTALQPLFNFFINNPQEFPNIVKKFKICEKELSSLIKSFSFESFDKLFHTMVDAWSYLPIWIQIGSANQNQIPKKYIEEATNLRDRFQDLEYYCGDLLTRAVKDRYPKFSNHTHLITFEEAMSGQIPNIEELRARSKSLIYFEGKVITNLSKQEFAKKYKVEIYDELGTVGELDSNIELLNLDSCKKELSQLAPIEYWAEELMPPLYGITDIRQSVFENDFMCVYENNTSILYFINNRHEKEAKVGFEFFRNKKSVEEYTKLVNNVLEKQRALHKQNPDLMEIIQVSREFNKIYTMTEAVRLKNFEHAEDEKTWNKFKKIAELRFHMRKELEEVLYAESDHALNELALARSIQKDDLFFYTYDELQELLREHTIVSQQVLSDRRSGYVYWIKGGRSVLYTGQKFRIISNELKKPQTDHVPNELKGRSVSKGVVTGKVRLILNNKRNIEKQIELFEEGEILVTEMTRPQTMMACYKAKAIITDEGGIVSHAAITASELKKPCVIGTKIATKILKNGDLVEVDGDKGV